MIHPFDPVCNSQSRILILGSFPSVRSRDIGFYYAHPQNRFWRVLARIYESDFLPMTTQERTAFVLEHQIALWDVIHSCEITGSSDASIRNAKANDLSTLLEQTSIEHIFCNGKRSYDLYCRYLEKQTGLSAVPLPSTSAANAAWSLDRLTAAWQIIRC